MKKASKSIRWVGVVFLALFAFASLLSGGLGILAAAMFGAAALIITPIKEITELRAKFKLSKVISIILSVLLIFIGIAIMPTEDISPADGNHSSFVSSVTSDVEESLKNDASSQESSSSKETTSSNQPSSSISSSISSTSTQSVGTGKAEPPIISSVSSYSGTPYVVLNNNTPNFSSSELTTTGYEKYATLDNLGRCGVAIASCGQEIMPAEGEERGSISSIKPTGWKQATYDNISGKYLYNRCHLIGWQLSAENDNNKNLITGTKYLNINGMLPFENMVADYIKETNNHVAYRITPIFEGNNLVCSGVQMEAYSIEDNGEGICFNVYCYNIQPGITINYATGESSGENSTSVESSSTSITTSAPEPESEPEPAPTPSSENLVWISNTGKRYHCKSSCSGMEGPRQVTESEAKGLGLTPCGRCF